MLEQRGSQLRVPISKELDEGIFELRISLAGNATRILHFFVIGNMAVLTNGFIKKTMKTPRYEIERAKRYRAEYLKRGATIMQAGVDWMEFREELLKNPKVKREYDALEDWYREELDRQRAADAVQETSVPPTAKTSAAPAACL